MIAHSWLVGLGVAANFMMGAMSSRNRLLLGKQFTRRWELVQDDAGSNVFTQENREVHFSLIMLRYIISRDF